MSDSSAKRDWKIVGIVCILAIAVLSYTIAFSSAGEVPRKFAMVAFTISEVEEAPDCALPVPAPACVAGNTICMEGNGEACHAAVYVCGGTPPVWGPAVRCAQNACNRNPGSIGSECQA